MSETTEPTTITLTFGDKSVDVPTTQEVAEAIFDHNASAIVYAVDVGENPEAHRDSFSTSRQRVLNALHELQASAKAHPIMEQVDQPLAFARSIAEQQSILVFNMLGQAGLIEARNAKRADEMRQMAEAKSLAEG